MIKSLSELELTEEERKRPRTDKTGDRGGKFAERPAKKPAPKPAETTAKEVKAEEKEAVKETKPKKEEKPMDMADLDSKLSSILDDSDLNMKL